ncbi:ATP-binding protein [Sporosarcina beigongshangi]|uniref:ATP-binding protein n=1 Tax=Sporosarcina beigongshangi TaxID=2782538 RepID=UPI001939C17C|nr:ATP-binding protein [Sporosarcina beigongshangi]
MNKSKTVVLDSGIEVPVAMYQEQGLIDYKGNPLIEALPFILSREEAFDQLSFLPPYHKNERNLSIQHRYHALLRLTQFFQPIGQTLELEQRFSRLIRYGYVNRNPLQKQHIQVLNELHDKLINKDELVLSPDIRTSASSFTLIGFPGIGKTSAIERIVSLYPQVILHQHPINIIQIVWLKLNCPHDGSLKTLCMNFFQKIDMLIGTNYYERYGRKINSISSMVIRMGQIARLHSIGVLIIDEIQHLLSAKGSASEPMMNFFVTLVNEIGIPVMFIGTMKAKALLQKDFRQARRSSGQGDMVWQQMNKDDNWNVLITSMWDYLWTKESVELNEEMNEIIYKESQAIIDVAIKLFILAQSRAIESGMEKVTPQLIRKVAKEDLMIMRPLLDALESGNVSEIAKYEDIIPMDIEEYIENRIPIIDIKQQAQIKKEKIKQTGLMKEVTNQEKLIISLVSMGIDAEIAENATKYVMKKSPDLTIKELMIEVIQYIDRMDEKKQSKRNIKNKPANNKLQIIIENGKKNKKSAYEALMDKGYIKNPFNDFIS